MIDSQSVKAPAAGGTRGFDGGKKVRRPQTSYRRPYRRTPAGGQPDEGRHLRQRRGSDDPSIRSANAGPASSTCLPMAPTTAGNSSIKRSSWASRSKSSGASTGASKSCRDDEVEQTFGWMTRYRRLSSHDPCRDEQFNHQADNPLKLSNGL